MSLIFQWNDNVSRELNVVAEGVIYRERQARSPTIPPLPIHLTKAAHLFLSVEIHPALTTSTRCAWKTAAAGAVVVRRHRDGPCEPERDLRLELLELPLLLCVGPY